MGYLILIGLFLFIAFILWLRQPIKKTIVYPIDLKTKKVKDALLSEKPRLKVIKEENGIVIGFGLAVLLAVGIWCMFGGLK